MKIARSGIVAGLLAVALAVQGCGKTADQDAPAPLAVFAATVTTESGPLMLAVRDIDPEGAGVQYGFVANLVDENAKGDVAGNAETQLLRYSVKHPNMRIIMTIVEGKYRIVARKSAGINSVADLKGKRIATSRNTSGHYFLTKMLEREGLTEDDVTIVPLSPFQRVAPGMESGEYDAVSIWEPFSENAYRVLGDDAIEFSGEGVYSEHYNLNTTAEALADPVKRKQIVELMRAIITATEKMNADPSEAHAIVAESGKYTVEEVAHSWPHHDFYAGFAEDMLDVLVDEEKWLAGHDNRQPRTREQLAPILDRSVYEEAMAGMGS